MNRWIENPDLKFLKKQIELAFERIQKPEKHTHDHSHDHGNGKNHALKRKKTKLKTATKGKMDEDSSDLENYLDVELQEIIPHHNLKATQDHYFGFSRNKSIYRSCISQDK